MNNKSFELRCLLYTTALAMLAIVSGQNAFANPEDGSVVAGSASISEIGQNLNIIQHTDRAVIDWRSFNIDVDEQTRFYQPNSDSIVINRVKNANPSQILGKLNANGNVVLINPNGVFFGKDAIVDVNGLVATSADIDNNKFMDGSLNFDKVGNPDASIVNDGRITAKEAGLVGLVAPNVLNNGIIEAKLGRVEMASGDTVTVDFRGNGLTEIAVSDNVKSQLVSNKGNIDAAGGKIALTAAAGKNIVNSLIEIKGELNAPAVSQKNGVIEIFAAGSNAVIGNKATDKGIKSGNSTIVVEAKINVSGKNRGEQGGSVKILGDAIQIKSGSLIDASADAGGGNIKIGGDYKGEGDTATASFTTIENGSTILNNALTSGNGGRTVVWSDDTTEFKGTIESKGGSQNGDGGFVETSGKKNLLARGHVDTTAEKGVTGNWLLDPTNITIYGNGTGGTDNINTFTRGYLETQSASTNITLTADTNLTLDMAGETMTLANNRNITLTATSGIITSASDGTILTSGTGTISLIAGANITLGSGVTLNTSGTGTTTLQAGGAMTTGMITSGGDVSLTSLDNMMLGTITTSNGKTVTATTNSAGKKITTSAISTGVNSNISLVSDDIGIGGNLSGTGVLTLETYTGGYLRDISIGISADDGSRYYLDTAELGRLIDGWSTINIGSASPKNNFYSNTAAFKDPVNFRTAYQGIYGNITGTGNASFNFSGSSDAYGHITTAGGSVVFNNYIVANGTVITTNGGAVTFNGDIRASNNATNVLVVSSGNGAITVNGNIYENADPSGKVLSFNAGTSTFTATGTINGRQDLSIIANNITLSSAIGGSVGLGDITLTAVNDLTLPSITTAAGKTVTATVTGSGRKITTAAIATGIGGNITLTADDLTLSGNLSGTGTVTLQPYATNRSVSINNNVDDGSYFNLATNELSRLVNNWSLINIGRINGTGDTYIYSAAFVDPVKLRSIGFRLTTGGAITGTDNASITFEGGALQHNGTITTNNQAVSFTNEFQTDGGSINTNGGAINFNKLLVNNGGNLSAVSGNGNINITGILSVSGTSSSGSTVNLNAGTGTVAFGSTVNTLGNITASGNTITFNGAWGGVNPLGNVSLTALNNISLPSIITSAGKAVAVTVAGAGNKISTSSIATGTNGNITLTSDDMAIGGNLSGTGTVTIKTNSLNRGVSVNADTDDGSILHLTTTEMSRLVNNWSSIVIAETAHTGSVNIGSVTFNDPVSFRGTGTKQFLGAFTGLGAASLYVEGNNVNIASNVTTAGQNVTFNVTAGSLGNFGDNTISTAGGAVNIGNLAMHSGVYGDNLTINSGNGNITISETISNINTKVSERTLTLNAGSGTVAFGNTVNTDANIVVTANTITVASAWGGSTGLGNVTLTALNDLTLPSITTGAGKTVNATVTGAGKKITTAAISTGMGGNITLTSDDLAMGGSLSGTGNITLQPYATNRTINLSNVGDDGSSYHLNTTELANLVNNWSNIYVGGAGTSSSLVFGTATSWIDPVTFRGDFKGIYADINGTGNASVTFLDGHADAFNNITTTNSNVTFTNSYLNASGGTISTTGGNVNFGTVYVGNVSGSTALTVNTGGGNINFVYNLDEYTNPVGKNVNLNAGTGNINFGSVIDGPFNLTASANSITFALPVGNVRGLGNITLTAVNDLTLPSITTTAGRTVNATVTGAGNKITTGTIATGAAGNITLTSDDVVIGGNLSGAGTVTLRQNALNRIVNINTGANDGSDYHLSTTEIGRLTDGWSNIVIGNVSGNNILNIGSITFTDPTKFENNGVIEIKSGATVTGTGNASFAFNDISSGGNLEHYGSIITAGGNVTSRGLTSHGATVTTNGGAFRDTQLIGIWYNDGNGFTLNTNGGFIRLNGIGAYGGDTSGKTVTLNAGAGNVQIEGGGINGPHDVIISGTSIDFYGTIGQTTPTGNITLTAVNNLSLPVVTTAAGKTFSATVTGAGNRITTSSIATGTNGAITLVSDNVTIGGALSGTGTLSLRPYSSPRDIHVNYGTDNGTSYYLDTTELAYLIDGWTLIDIAANAGYVNLGTSTWKDPTKFTTAVFQGAVNGTGNASFVFAGAMTYINSTGASLTTAGGAIDIQSTLRAQTFGNGIFNIASNGGAVNIVSMENNHSTGVSVASANGNITVGAITSGDGISKSLVFDAGTGTIAFTGTVTNANGPITLTANANTITTNGDWGVNGTPLGAVTLTALNDITLPTIYASSVNATVTGTGSKITTGAISTGTSGDITLIADDLVIAGALSGTGTLLLKPYDIARTINVNTGANDGSNFNLATGELANVIAGWGMTTIGSLAHNGAVNAGAATWNSNISLLANNGMISLNGVQNTGNHTFLARTAGTGDITIGSAGGVTNTASGDAIVLASGRDFINSSASASVLNTTNGRWLVYSTGPANNVRGALMPNATALYNTNYVGNAPVSIASGNRFLFSSVIGTAPILTFTADDKTKVYGTINGSLTYTVTGYIGADDSSNAWQGSAAIATLVDNTTGAGTHTDEITISAGSLASYLGYQFAYDNGNYEITKADLTITADNATKVYGDTLVFNGSEYTYQGLVNGDSITSVDIASSGATSGATQGAYSITVNNAIGNGLSNYNVVYQSGLLTVLNAPDVPYQNPVKARYEIPQSVEYNSQIFKANNFPENSSVKISDSSSSLSKLGMLMNIQSNSNKPLKVMNNLLEIDPQLLKEIN